MNYRLHRIKLTWNFIILIVLLTSFNTVFAGEGIQGITQVEGTEFEVGEQFTVQYILKSVGQRLQGNYQISGNNFGELEVLGQNSGNSTSIINGSISQEVTITYYLKSKKIGVFKIPGIQFLLNGKKYPCQDKTVQIIKQKKDSGINGDLILKLKSTKSSVYVGEPFRIDLHWYSAFQTKGFRMKELPKFDGFIVKTIPSETKNKIRTINGKKYLTNKDFSFILTPIKPGKTTLPAVKGDMYLTTGRGFFTQTETQEITSNRLTVDVKPLPIAESGITQPVIVGNFKAKSTCDKKELNVNDAVTIRITISGSGNLNTLNDLTINLPSAFETLPATVKDNIKTNLNGINGSKTFEFVAIPRQPGEFKIPPITLWAFNPKKKKYYDIKTTPINIKVTGAGKGDIQPYISSGGGKKVELQGSDIRYLNKIENLSNDQTSSFTGSFAHLMLIIFSVLGFGVGVFGFRKRILSKDQIKSNNKSKAKKVAKKYLKNAEKEIAGDKSKFYALVDEAINSYLLGKLMIDRSQLKKETIITHLKNQMVEEHLINQTIKVSNDCKMARFSPIVLSPKEMYAEAERIIHELETQLKR